MRGAPPAGHGAGGLKPGTHTALEGSPGGVEFGEHVGGQPAAQYRSEPKLEPPSHTDPVAERPALDGSLEASEQVAAEKVSRPSSSRTGPRQLATPAHHSTRRAPWVETVPGCITDPLRLLRPPT